MDHSKTISVERDDVLVQGTAERAAPGDDLSPTRDNSEAQRHMLPSCTSKGAGWSI